MSCRMAMSSCSGSMFKLPRALGALLLCTVLFTGCAAHNGGAGAVSSAPSRSGQSEPPAPGATSSLPSASGPASAGEKELFLPEAANDQFTTVIGLPGANGGGTDIPPPKDGLSLPESASAQGSVDARAANRYPVGTTQIELIVTNNSESGLLYTHAFDIRRLEDGQVIPLTPRTAVSQPDESLILPAGETVTLQVPLDIYEEPLTAGTYMAVQLACFTDTNGQALACTGIEASFELFQPF
ncbi:immunoglobulin-like domain-containing protein [Anaerotruncus colihominis]|uniref:immunoglobulin-like domain-containing protein n=1 Tax=Anaerotruncus colihominis TaxID=169435 RepID=UPI0026F2EC6D|nr:immunoglobulin-like domain-containing protein [Anaerotruncus colihominis]